jgi:hypothetical protein
MKSESTAVGKRPVGLKKVFAEDLESETSPLLKAKQFQPHEEL